MISWIVHFFPSKKIQSMLCLGASCLTQIHNVLSCLVLVWDDGAALMGNRLERSNKTQGLGSQVATVAMTKLLKHQAQQPKELPSRRRGFPTAKIISSLRKCDGVVIV